MWITWGRGAKNGLNKGDFWGIDNGLLFFIELIIYEERVINIRGGQDGRIEN